MSQPQQPAEEKRLRANDRIEPQAKRGKPDKGAPRSIEAPSPPPSPAPPPAAGSPMHELFDERELSIDAHCRIQKFFLAMDRRTDPRTAEVALRAPMRALMRAYDERQSYRVYYASVGKGLDLGAPAPELLATAREVSHIFVDCAQVFAGHPWDLASFAFELFAAGRLVTAHPDPALQERLCMHGAPDGWNFFQFAEHGFACVAAGIDAGFWDPLLLALVESADLLAHRGRGPLEKRMPSEVRSARYAHWDGRMMPMTEVQHVRERYRASVAGVSGVERRQRLADLFAHALGVAGFGRFTTVFHPPGALRPLLEPNALGAPAVP